MENVRNKQIDGLRGVMALMIVFFHLFCRYQQLYCNSSLRFMENWGAYGVCTFFIISGYFLVNDREKQNFRFLHFMKRKIIRLYPSYFVCLTITSCILVVLDLPDNNVTTLNFVLNASWINGFIGTPYIDGAHWYITILLSVTFVYGVLRKLDLANKPVAYLLVMILNSACYAFNIPVIPIILGGGYIGMVTCGIAIHQLKREKRTSRNFWLWIVLMLISMTFTWKLRGIPSLVGLLFGTLIFVGTINKKIFILQWRGFQYLGAISFELYLIHQNIGYAIEYKFWSMSNGFSYLYALIALMIVLSLGSLIYGAIKLWNNKKKGINRT